MHPLMHSAPHTSIFCNFSLNSEMVESVKDFSLCSLATFWGKKKLGILHEELISPLRLWYWLLNYMIVQAHVKMLTLPFWQWPAVQFKCTIKTKKQLLYAYEALRLLVCSNSDFHSIKWLDLE